jgi:hypothetical protein
MQSVLKIFIAGSTELMRQREIVKNEISNFNTLIYHENIYFAPFSFENFPNALTDERQQVLYNNFIENEADIMILLVKCKINHISKEEFKLAYSSCNKKKHPATFVFNEYYPSADLTELDNFFKNYDYYTKYTSDAELRLLVHNSLQMYLNEIHKADSKFSPVQRNSIMNFHRVKISYAEAILKNVRSTNNYIDLEGTFIDNYEVIPNDDFAGLGEDILNDDIFNNEPNNDDENPDSNLEKFESIKLSTILDSCNRLILIGNPGTGKTTILTKIFKNKCSSFIEGDEERIPVYIKLSLLSRSTSLQQEILRILKAEWAKDYLNNNIILLLDGLNEIAVSEHKHVISEIEVFLQRYPKVPVVITSRKHGFNNIGSLPVFEIKPLSKLDIYKYIENKIGRVDAFQQIMESRSLCELATNPMNLSLILKTWEYSKSIPSNKAELYNRYIDLMFKREANKRNGEIIDTSKKYLLSKIAYKMKSLGTISIKSSAILSIIDDVRNEFCLFIDKISILNELLHDGLLIKDFNVSNCDDSISFVHETYLEYFAACHILDSYRNYGSLDKSIYEPEWSEILKISLELIYYTVPDSQKANIIDEVRTNLIGEIDCNRISHFYEIMHPLIQQCNIAQNYMEQYMFFIMNKIKNGETSSEEHKDLFAAIALLSSKAIFNIILFDQFWRQKWATKPSVRDVIIMNTSKVFLLYNKVEMINDSNMYIPMEEIKAFEKLEKGLFYKLSDGNLKYLYNKTKYQPYLYVSNDVKFLDENKEDFINGLNKNAQNIKYLSHNMINRAYFDFVFTEIYDKLHRDLQISLLAKAFSWFPSAQIIYDKLLKLKHNYKEVEIFLDNLRDELYFDTPPLLYSWFKQLDAHLKIDAKYINVPKSSENLNFILSKNKKYICRREIIECENFIDAINSLDADQKESVVKKFLLYEYFPDYISKSKLKVYAQSRLNKRILYTHKGRTIASRKLLNPCNLEENKFIFIKHKRAFIAIENSMAVKEHCGFMKGVVSTKKDNFCHIYAKETRLDYFAHFSECHDSLSVGDIVSFFPTINLRENKHMAVAVEVIGTCRKDGTIKSSKISAQGSDSFIYVIIDNNPPYKESYAFDKRRFEVGEQCTYMMHVYKSNDRAIIL